MNILKRTLAGLLVVFLAFGQVTSIPGIVDAILGASNITTAGACVYVSASGTLNQDSPGCHWDATNNRLGLGTASPTAPFDILTTSASPIDALARLRNTYTDAYIPILEMLAPNMTAGQEVYSTIGLSATVGNRAGFSFTYVGNNSASNRLAIGNFFGGAGGPLYILNSGSAGIGPSNTSPTGTLHVYDATPTTGVTTLTVRAGAGQSSTVLQQWLNNAGSTLVSVSSGGDVLVSGATGGGSAVYAQGSGYLGWATRSRMYSPSDGVITIYNSGATDYSMTQYGGTTAAFPAHKRFGNALALRLATDAVPAFSALTACASGGEGALVPVSDSSTATWGATITGGGANRVLAYCNGTNWTVAAK